MAASCAGRYEGGTPSHYHVSHSHTPVQQCHSSVVVPLLYSAMEDQSEGSSSPAAITAVSSTRVSVPYHGIMVTIVYWYYRLLTVRSIIISC